MRPCALSKAEVLLGLLLLAATARPVVGQEIPPASVIAAENTSFQLEVFINGKSTELVGAFRRNDRGRLAIDPIQLENIGLKADADATGPDNLVDIARLPGVSFVYDETNQTVSFSAEEASLATRKIDVTHRESQDDVSEEESASSRSETSAGAVLNYTLYGATGGEDLDDITEFQGLSAGFEARIFSAMGVLTSSQIISTTDAQQFDTMRLDTTWSYSSENQTTTYRVGDITTGGLGWTRPARLGGIQAQRNFSLRPDLVTIPMPLLSGSAAVPSTVDVYVNNAHQMTADVPAGPFSINNLPMITGSGTARLVVRDALGRETVSDSAFSASADLLAPGLWDFSGEAGFARRSYATASFDYDERLMVSATARYGATNWLTLEGHGEFGDNLVNAGTGFVAGLGALGIGSFAGAFSRHGEDQGLQLSASLEGDILGLHVFARSQRSFGDYDDIASVTADADIKTGSIAYARAPVSLDQLSVSLPQVFDSTNLNFSYTQMESSDKARSRLLGLTANRMMGHKGNTFVTAYTDLEKKGSFGLFAGLSWSFSDEISASSGLSIDDDGYALTADVSRMEKGDVGSTGWRLRGMEGDQRSISAAGSYRSPFGRMEGGVEQSRNGVATRAQFDGAMAVAGSGVFFSNRIEDAFGIVNVGAPDVDVEVENRPVGRSGRNGKLLVPDLNSYDDNTISIDPSSLGLDASIETTRAVVVPRERSGVVVDLGVRTGNKSRLVTLVDENGGFVEAGASATIDGSGTAAVVGYDGQAYLTKAATGQQILVDQPSKGRCVATLVDITDSQTSKVDQRLTCRSTS